MTQGLLYSGTSCLHLCGPELGAGIGLRRDDQT
jgi:hypothetical protein